jgi:CRISPR-associated protein Cmr2
MSEYIGVTIGPVIDTLSLTATPAGLWAASYTFSQLARLLCEKLTDPKTGIIGEADVLSPFFGRGEALLQRKDGIGLFHDRIIFRRPGGFTWDVFNGIVTAAKNEIAQTFTAENEDHRPYFQAYLRVAAAAFEAEDGVNPILASLKLLDALELEAAFVAEQSLNPILSLFDNRAAKTAPEFRGKNENIKKSAFVRALDSWPLYADGNADNIKKIEDIAACGVSPEAQLKKHTYCAVVHADGDNMTNVFASLSADQVRDFSQICLQFASDASERVGRYGGVPIYAGGDDLLFLAPVEGVGGRSLFALLQELGEQFDTRFAGFAVKPTLSFGAAVCFRKYPLYEALKHSRSLLFDRAKAGKDKNAIAIRFQKHSGSSDGLLIDKRDGAAALKRLDNWATTITAAQAEGARDFLRSAEHKLVDFQPLFAAALEQGEAALAALFANLFNEDVHGEPENKAHLDKVRTLLWDVYREACPLSALEPRKPAAGTKGTEDKTEDAKCVRAVDTVCNTLSILQFLVEKAGEEEKADV